MVISLFIKYYISDALWTLTYNFYVFIVYMSRATQKGPKGNFDQIINFLNFNVHYI